METAAFRYTSASRPGVAVDLIGAVHVGDKAYYDKLNELFEKYEVVLYELVAPEGTRIPKGGRKAGSGHPIGMMQEGMSSILELRHQLDCVDYTKDNLIHADMTPDEFSKTMDERGESFFNLADAVHPREVFDQVLLRLTDEVLPGVELGEAEVGRGSTGIDAEDLAAERDGVVEEPLLGIELGGLLVGAQRGQHVAGLELQVADAIIEPRILGAFLPGLLRLPDGLKVDIDRAAPFLALFEFSSSFLQFIEIHRPRGTAGPNVETACSSGR